MATHADTRPKSQGAVGLVSTRTALAGRKELWNAALTGFNICKKHEETKQVSSVQGLFRYFSS
eukprot:COSAG01_NODE_12743_length_1692_cov_0.810421_1_plen_63_part_10